MVNGRAKEKLSMYRSAAPEKSARECRRHERKSFGSFSAKNYKTLWCYRLRKRNVLKLKTEFEKGVKCTRAGKVLAYAKCIEIQAQNIETIHYMFTRAYAKCIKTHAY